MSKREWYEKGTLRSLIDLLRIRSRMRQKNLYSTQPEFQQKSSHSPQIPEHYLKARSVTGEYNDLNCPEMGAIGKRFGRNVPLSRAYPESGEALLSPDPRLVSRKLMTRREFIPAQQINVLAAAWIQLQQHGWFNHLDDEKPLARADLLDPEDRIDLELADDDPWPAAEPLPEPGAFSGECRAEQFRPLRIPKTPRDPNPPAEELPPTYVNTMSHWWDASQIYGSSEKRLRSLRSGIDGKLKVGPEGGLRYSPKSTPPEIPCVGFRDNWWIGLALLYEVFIREHNAICDHLKSHYPDLDDDELFEKARLVLSALLAKIHTVEWTPALLKTPALEIAMKGNWFGLKRDRRPFYRHVVSRVGQLLDRLRYSGETSEAYHGIPETDPDHHAAEFSMTEEFAAMYRMHPLIPDDFEFRSLVDDQPLMTKNLFEVSGKETKAVLEQLELKDLAYTFGTDHPGALRLHNYPRFLQNLKRDNGDRFDLATIDILRDRERGVPRYNDFRELVHKPRLGSFDELTDDPKLARELEEVYGDIDRVDLLVGMLAEPLPEGFAFSDTTFRIFILMASRRIKSDRFLTTDYRPEVYTREGLDWIEKNTMATCLLRHIPELESVLSENDNAFFPWKRTS